jgi:alkaline phosphatase
MKNWNRIAFIVAWSCFSSVAISQVTTYTVSNAHSHNDYLGQSPFYMAFEKGFGSIEADVFPVNGNLCVAHSKNEIDTQRTLQGLYLQPLTKEFSTQKMRKMNLLIDIKEDHKTCLSLLIKELEPLNTYLSTPEQENYLTIIISGERPLPANYKDYPAFIFFDSDLKSKHTPEEWKRVALVSLPFNKISAWKGTDDLAKKDEKSVKTVIDNVHQAGKPVRFWAAPDTELSWSWQMKLKADFIGTDKITELSDFLSKKND